MPRLLFAIAAIAASLALSAAAQPVYDVGALPKGATFTWRAHNGNATVKFIGQNGQLFKFRYSRDASPRPVGQSHLMVRPHGQYGQGARAQRNGHLHPA